MSWQAAEKLDRSVCPRQIAAIAHTCNNTPRKCLGFRTPAEVLLQHLLHFKCESTYWLSPA